jgi:HNH endonuclease
MTSLLYAFSELQQHAHFAGNAWQADHIQAVFQGGGLCDISNMQTLCTICHAERTKAQAKARSHAKKAGGAQQPATNGKRARTAVATGAANLLAGGAGRKAKMQRKRAALAQLQGSMPEADSPVRRGAPSGEAGSRVSPHSAPGAAQDDGDDSCQELETVPRSASAALGTCAVAQIV